MPSADRAAVLGRAGGLAALLALAACGPGWPPAGTGGLAERFVPATGEAAALEARLAGPAAARVPGRAAEIRQALIRARREEAAGLAEDAARSRAAVRDALDRIEGGSPRMLAGARP